MKLPIRKDSLVALIIFVALTISIIIISLTNKGAEAQKLAELKIELAKHIPTTHKLHTEILETENAATQYEKAFLYSNILNQDGDYFADQEETYTLDHSKFIHNAQSKIKKMLASKAGVSYSEISDKFIVEDPKNKLTDKDKELALYCFNHTDEVLTLLDEAITKPDCIYNVNLNNLHELSSLRALARHLKFRSYIINKSNPEETTKCIEHIIHIGNSLQKMPCLIASLVRIAIINIGCHAYQKLPHKELISNEALEKLKCTIDQTTTSLIDSQACVLVNEVFCFWEYMDSLSQKDLSYWLRHDYGLFYVTYKWARLNIETWHHQYCLVVCNNIKNSELARYDIATLNRGVPAIPNYTTSIKRMLSNSTSSIDSFHSSLFCTIAQLRATKAGIDIELFKRKHNRLPKDPSEIKDWPEDPFTPSGGLKYLITPTGFKVYSVGKDGVDDGGALDYRVDVGIEIEVKQ